MISDNGYIVSIWKEPDWTSNDIIKFLKPQVRPLKIGHAGTLDPFASGVLIVCVGKMTKKVSFFMEEEKEYTVKIKFGKRTDTLDLTGKVINEKKYVQLDDKNLLKVLNNFIGKINQIPPMYSALKQNGKRLYSLARKGIIVDREPRKVRIKKIDLIENNEDNIIIKVLCGKGTYIRSLARDLAHKLNTEGYVEELTRNRIGEYDQNSSINVKEFKDWLQSKQHLMN
tara:strand:- start:1938 stop:2618 length:681 start_codon:yes stop_codon:yes gene_type:complete